MRSRGSDRSHASSHRTINSSPSPAEPVATAPVAGPADQAEQDRIEEQRKLRRLQLMMDLVMSVISQDRSLTIDQAAQMVADSKKAALAMFPDKEMAYNIIYKPRLQRLMRERYRIQ